MVRNGSCKVGPVSTSLLVQEFSLNAFPRLLLLLTGVMRDRDRCRGVLLAQHHLALWTPANASEGTPSAV